MSELDEKGYWFCAEASDCKDKDCPLAHLPVVYWCTVGSKCNKTTCRRIHREDVRRENGRRCFRHPHIKARKCWFDAKGCAKADCQYVHLSRDSRFRIAVPAAPAASASASISPTPSALPALAA